MTEFRTQRKIEFVDTDMGGIVHFSRFFAFMETAEHQFLNALGTNVMLELDGRTIGWPRVAASCEYSSPARFGDVIDILVRVKRKGRTSMTYQFDFSREGRELARGTVTAVCCEFAPKKEIRPIPIPAFIADRIEDTP